MKKFLRILVLSLFLITPSQADDIRDFQIEGMSLGDSLLDHFSKREIKNGLKTFYPGSNKLFIIEIKISSEIYDSIMLQVKSNDKKYKIYGLTGTKYFENNIEDCYKLKNKITKEIGELFVNVEKDSYKKKTFWGQNRKKH